jgi:adenylosuccinate lyase
MPHKRNPINLENIKSMWKVFAPRMGTLYMDQLSEHQRDLTNSASSRFASEMLAALYLTAGRAGKIMGKLAVDKESMERNLGLNSEMIIAEPLYILLAAHGHPDAHECVKQLTLEAQKTGRPLRELVASDKGLKPYLERFTGEQRAVIENPVRYTGIASKKAEGVCRTWKERLGI